MINEILLSEIKLKKKVMNDNKNFFKTEKNNYIINKEKKLTKSCHFDYQEITQTVVKKIVMKKVRKIVKKTDQKRFRVSEQRSIRISDNKI